MAKTIRLTEADNGMTKADTIIAELVNALATIRRHADDRRSVYACDFISGVAEQAIKQCDAHRERNRHGYMVVREAR